MTSGKIKLLLYTTWSRIGGKDGIAPLIRTSAVGGAEWSASLPIRFTPGEIFPVPSEQDVRRYHNQFSRFGEENPFPRKGLNPGLCSSLLDLYIDYALQARTYASKILLATG